MKLEDALNKARQDAIANNTSITLYRDPIGLGEQDGFDTPWGWCPTPSLPIIGKHRESEHDIEILPNGTVVFGNWHPKSHWDNHPDFPHADWVAEVQANDTRESYIDWVNNNIHNITFA